MNSIVTVTYDSSDPTAVNVIKSIRKFDCLKVSRAVPEHVGNDKTIQRIKKAARNAKKLAASDPKTYSPKELMEIL